MKEKKVEKSNLVVFPTKYREKTRFRSNLGTRMQPTYQMSIDDDGKRELKKVGEINLYAKIQSFKDSVDINYLLARFARGDEHALSKVQGIYGDFTHMPTTYAELAQRVTDAENLFNNLPLDIRKEFNFSASEFFASIGTEKYETVFKDYNDKLVPPEAAPVPVESVQQVTPAPVVTMQEGVTA